MHDVVLAACVHLTRGSLDVCEVQPYVQLNIISTDWWRYDDVVCMRFTPPQAVTTPSKEAAAADTKSLPFISTDVPSETGSSVGSIRSHSGGYTLDFKYPVEVVPGD